MEIRIENPIVSIITPFYNSKRWLAEVVSVTKAQTLRNFEHLLVDDCSTDGGSDELNSIIKDDPRYRILTLAQNSGPSVARNLALNSARGQYVAFLDSDDIWLPDKLEEQVKWMIKSGYALSFHDYRFMSHDGKLIGNLVNGPNLLNLRTLHTHRGVGCLAVMIDRFRIKEFRFPEFSAKAIPEDYVAWFSLIKDGHMGHRLPKDLGRYRVSNNSRSANKLKAAKAMWTVFRGVEKLPLFQAFVNWCCYALVAYVLHWRAKPMYPNSHFYNTEFASKNSDLN